MGCTLVSRHCVALHCPLGLLCDWLKMKKKKWQHETQLCNVSNAVIQANNNCKAVEILKCLRLKFFFSSLQNKRQPSNAPYTYGNQQIKFTLRPFSTDITVSVGRSCITLSFHRFLIDQQVKRQFIMKIQRDIRPCFQVKQHIWRWTATSFELMLLFDSVTQYN